MKPHIQLPPYFGGKAASGVPHAIINQIPRHDTFISAFLGHCAILRHKRPAERNIGFEINPDVCAVWQKALAGASLKLAILQRDFLTVEPLDLWLNSPHGTFVYADPPYPLATRRSRHRYPHELTDDQHEQLLANLDSMPCMVAISTYDNPLYAARLADWRKITFQSTTRGNTPATETLYMNYPEPSPLDLHDPRFVGADFRQREKSKRRIETLERKIARLSPDETARLAERLKTRFPELF
jgi:site-specific DNA-adenine methylase